MTVAQDLPGYETGRSVAPRNIFHGPSKHTIEQGILIDGDNSIDGGHTGYTYILRPGSLMALITASKKWVPCKRTAVTRDTETSSADDSTTVLNVTNAAFFAVGDSISVGSFTGLTITAISYTSNTITVDDAINADDGDAVVTTDGSQTCRGILLDEVKLRNAENTAAADKNGHLLIAGGLVDADQLLGDSTAIRADSSAQLSHIVFGDNHGR